MNCCVLLLWLGTLGQPQDAMVLPTAEQLAADIDELASVVRTQWSYFEDRREHGGLDVDALVASTKIVLPALQGPCDVDRVISEFVAALQDGHANVVVPGCEDEARWWPLTLSECAEGLVVSSVVVDEAVREAGGRVPERGDLITAIDGTAIEEAIAQAALTTFASTAPARRSQAIRRLHESHAEQVTFGCVAPSGERYETRLATADEAPIALDGRGDNWSLSFPAEGVACLRISSFAVADWQRWLAAKVHERDGILKETYGLIDERFKELKSRDIKGLIIDLRGNGGGTDLLGIRVAKNLLAKPFIYMRLSAIHGGAWTPPGGMTTRPVTSPFAGKVVALVDSACFSTTDNFLRCLTDLHPQFTVIGRPTGGGTGAPRPVVELQHSRATVTLCTMRVYGPTSGLIEGRGTTPDIPIVWTRDDYCGGLDPDLTAALDHLK